MFNEGGAVDTRQPEFNMSSRLAIPLDQSSPVSADETRVHRISSQPIAGHYSSIASVDEEIGRVSSVASERQIALADGNVELLSSLRQDRRRMSDALEEYVLKRKDEETSELLVKIYTFGTLRYFTLNTPVMNLNNELSP
jgi:hypothetical protein